MKAENNSSEIARYPQPIKLVLCCFQALKGRKSSRWARKFYEGISKIPYEYSNKALATGKYSDDFGHATGLYATGK